MIRGKLPSKEKKGKPLPPKEKKLPTLSDKTSRLGKKFELRPFETEWSDHGNDASLYALYRSMQAPYAFLEHCKALLESKLGELFHNFFLVPRGSVQHGIALRGDADLDLDFILPRAFITYEALVEECQTEPDGKCNDFIPYKEKCKEIGIAISDLLYYQENAKSKSLDVNITLLGEATGKVVIEDEDEDEEEEKEVDIDLDELDFESSVDVPENIGISIDLENSNSISRSLEYTMRVHGTTVSVDIFPKFIGQNGSIWSLGKAKNGTRQWVEQSLMNRSVAAELNDEQRAAILFIKFWKAQNKAKFKVLEHFKGYHIGLAMEKILEKNPDNIDADNEPKDKIQFRRDKISNYILDILEYLEAGYFTESDGDWFVFPTMNYNPFYQDLEEDEKKSLVYPAYKYN